MKQLIAQPAATNSPQPSLTLQRKCACGSGATHKECESCRTKRAVQRQFGAPDSAATPSCARGLECNFAGTPAITPRVEQALGEPGHPLEPGLRAFFERAFSSAVSTRRAGGDNMPFLQTVPSPGISRPFDAPEAEADRLAATALNSTVPAAAAAPPHIDFSAIRVHTGPAAAQSARDVQALAYTSGRHIVFGEGRYAPHTGAGRQLLAHELVHTMQQTASPQGRSVQRVWDGPNAAVNCDGEPTDKWVKRVDVDQETPQSATVTWSDGSIESSICSTGKGHCCVDTPDGTACDTAGSRVNGSNCTPTGASFPISNRERKDTGWRYWSTFVPARGIALHWHSRVTAEPASHGCVRLPEEMAKKIWCGAHQNQTMVHVHGFARPQCSSPSVQLEWQDNFNYAGTNLDGEPAGSPLRRGVTEERATLRRIFHLTDPELTQRIADVRANPASLPPTIPRCTATAALPANPFEGLLIPFQAALQATRSFTQAELAARGIGIALWQAAASAFQRATGVVQDERALFNVRSNMISALRSWTPSFALTSAQRDSLVLTLENASRGTESVAFPAAASTDKRVLISGFDPFGPSAATARNPSATAVQLLDGATLTNGAVRARVEGVVFPVVFSYFDAGRIESFFRPFLNQVTPVNMIMTISLGGGSSDFQVEEFAGRRRSSDPYPDNAGQTGGGTMANPAVPVGLAAGPEFLQTALPTGTLRTALGRSAPTSEETDVFEIRSGSTSTVTSSRPTTGSTAVAGSGGGFLSNEIMYRTLLLRQTTGATIPVGHLHVPDPTVAPLTPMQIAAEVRRLIESTLPTL